MQFNKEDLTNLGIFLNRVELKGNEAMALAVLQQKLVTMISALPVEEKKEEEKKK